MDYLEAIKLKENLIKQARHFTLEHIKYMIVPSNIEDFIEYIRGYSETPETFDDESCFDYCSDTQYTVYGFGNEKFIEYMLNK